MKYLITIPKPKSDRMLPHDKVLMVHFNDVFCGASHIKRCTVPANEWECIIDIGETPLLRDISGWVDVSFARIYVEFTNASGSRKEKFEIPNNCIVEAGRRS